MGNPRPDPSPRDVAKRLRRLSLVANKSAFSTTLIIAVGRRQIAAAFGIWMW